MRHLNPSVSRWLQKAIDDPDGFWAEAAEQLTWFRKWDRVLEWEYPTFRWFIGGQTNLSYNCLDHHVVKGRGDHTALVYLNERGRNGVFETSGRSGGGCHRASR